MHPIETDFAAFDALIRRESGNFFVSGAPVWVARAPGRLDVMGGIADYSGSLVAEMPIAQAALCAAQAGGTTDGAVIVRSANAAAENLAAEVTLPGEVFINPVSLLKFLRESPAEMRWAGYVAGCFSLLRAEGLIPRKTGGRLLLQSNVPLGAGVSSSAAIEVASMRALCAAFHVEMDGMALARLCQRVENDVMDAPCGIMDQVTAAFGESGKLLLLLCQPHQVQGNVAFPEGWCAFGMDSGVKHSVAGNAYTRTRVAAFMGFKMLADKAGSGFGGHLCNISPDLYREIVPERLPETMTGGGFLAVHQGIYDSVTSVLPGETYFVRAAAEHAIHENHRVRRFIEQLRIGDGAAFLEAGIPMNDAHFSYSACGLGSEETDILAQMARELPGVAGAKITGGGSGGTVCVLCESDREEEIAQTLATRYAATTNLTPRLIRGTSPGALATPARLLQTGK